MKRWKAKRRRVWRIPGYSYVTFMPGKSLQQWLDEMEQHQDVAVRGGVKLTREYVQYLKDEIGRLRHENEVKNAYLKKLREKK